MFLFRLGLLILITLPFCVSSFAEQEQSEPTNDSEPATEAVTEPAQSSNDKTQTSLDAWPQPPSQSQLLSLDLAQLYLPEQTIELDPQKQITVVVHQSQHSPTLGYVLIQPQWDSVPFDSRKNPIQTSLTRQGWHVITLLPQAKLNLQGTDEEKMEQYNQYLKLTAERLSLLAQLPETQTGYSLVLAEQNMATVMLALYRQQLAPLPNAMVLLGANKLTVQQNQQLANDLSAISIPVLDIFQMDNQQMASLNQARAQAVQKSGKQQFRQLALNGPFLNEHLGKYINGWTRSLGWK